MMTNRNSTMMPPTYSTICTANRNSACCSRYSPATPSSETIRAIALCTAFRRVMVRTAPPSTSRAKA